MARYTGSDCRLCRAEKMKLFLKGARCNTEKCAFAKRPTIPGMHTRGMSKASYYAIQLREKQKVKRTYGILEAQFRRFFDIASKAKGVTGRTLLQLIERRLDNVIFRALCSTSRDHARQMVLHGFVFVNKKRVNIASYLIKTGDEIEIKGKDSFKKAIQDGIDLNAKMHSSAAWLSVDKDTLTMKVLRLPEKEDMNMPINEQLIIELYSK